MGYWQNGVTPINEDNMNKIMMCKGDVPSTDFNQITEPGIYYTGGATMTNAPNNYTYRYLEVVAKGGTVVYQKVFDPLDGQIQIREYFGNPGEWKPWKTFNAEIYNRPLASQQTVTVTLEPLRNYLLIATNYGQGSVGTNFKGYIVSTGQSTSNTSRVLEAFGTNASLISASFSNGLTLSVTSDSGLYNIVSLTRL